MDFLNRLDELCNTAIHDLEEKLDPCPTYLKTSLYHKLEALTTDIDTSCYNYYNFTKVCIPYAGEDLDLYFNKAQEETIIKEINLAMVSVLTYESKRLLEAKQEYKVDIRDAYSRVIGLIEKYRVPNSVQFINKL